MGKKLKDTYLLYSFSLCIYFMLHVETSLVSKEGVLGREGVQLDTFSLSLAIPVSGLLTSCYVFLEIIPRPQREIHTVYSFTRFKLCSGGTFSVRPCQVCLPKILSSPSLCPHTPRHFSSLPYFPL